MRLLGKPTSINVRKVLWTCAAIGIDVTQETPGSGTDMDNRERLSMSVPDPGVSLLALNPNGMVPVLVDAGAVLWESNTICRYLAARHAREDLLPAAPLARAQVEKWMDWQVAELNGAWRYAFMALVRRSGAHTDPDAIAASSAAWNRHMAILDGQLNGAYVCGGAFTLADIVLGLSTNRWLSTPIERPELPALADWYARLARHPGFAAHCANGVP